MKSTYNHMERDRDRQRGPAIPLSQLSPAFQPLQPRHLTRECIILEILVQSGTRMTAAPADMSGAEEPSR